MDNVYPHINAALGLLPEHFWDRFDFDPQPSDVKAEDWFAGYLHHVEGMDPETAEDFAWMMVWCLEDDVANGPLALTRDLFADLPDAYADDFDRMRKGE